jgi:hypothetical protein
MIGLLLLSLTTQSQEFSEPVPAPFNNVQECVTACEEALKEADIYIRSLKNQSSLQDSLIDEQQKVLQVQDKELHSFYRNPVTMGLIGLAVGGFLFRGK